MSLASRPWTAHEDMFLRQLAAAGKFAPAIAAEMRRSESAIRKRATKLKITLAKVQRGPKAKATAK
jgi:hypothetical protein